MKSPGIALVLAAALMPQVGSCAMIQTPASCFSRTGASYPTLAKVRANLTNGEAGRRMAEAVFAGDLAAVERLARGDGRLLTTRVALPQGTRPHDGNTGGLLSFAVAGCNPEMVGLLLELGADPDEEPDGGPLSLATLADDLVMAEMLLQAGADPDGAAKSGVPVREALMFEKHDGLLLLLGRGANPDLSGAFGATPLDTALGIGDWQAAKILMESGANPWQAANKGALPVSVLAATTAPDAASEAIRRELLAKAKRPGLPWPPPSIRETQDNIHSGKWPTPEMERAGFVVTPQARRSVEMVVGSRGPQPQPGTPAN